MSVSLTTRSGQLPRGDFKLCKSVEKAFTGGKTARITSSCCVSCECSPELKRIIAPLFSVELISGKLTLYRAREHGGTFSYDGSRCPQQFSAIGVIFATFAGRSPTISEMTLVLAASF